uniref:Uncharacterized protein n=1 Tax=Aegilops tauschii subsp. strangulata TaxID=200361 RepID=A0A453T110_AEGTS
SYIPASSSDSGRVKSPGKGNPGSPGTGTFSNPRLMIALVPTASVRQLSSLFKAILM